ncbi:MAG TPA: TetR/AcrR family transcriptional regulator [Campylobacterales bacterium]|nr:TetR/AcrR family transcriptional regulator [Campylobacterales bacterium]
MKKTTKKRDATLSKQLILDNAKLLFSQKGFQASSMDELSKMTGLNKAMIFYYFKNKQGLYEAVITEILHGMYEEIAKNNEIELTPTKQLESFIKTYANYACSHSYFPALLLKELSSSGAKIPEHLFFAMRKLYSIFSDIIKAGEESGEFKEVIPMILYFMIIGTLNLMITTKPIRQKAQISEEFDLDTCASCDIDEIANYIILQVKKIVI